ncbi:MAG: DUF1566 domain-containing protein [Campylobacteraceae bacterium]|nr:DUF1566 domain-containing protein [Campylobacteraceae bacterium]
MKKLIVLCCTLFTIYANGDFINKSKSIIQDNQTSFLWQDTKEVKTIKRDFTEAVSYCKDLELDGIKGWELPNLKQLFTIVNTKKYNPAIYEEFKNINPDTYWTSKLFSRGASNDAYTITFKTGSLYRRNMNDKFFVRCIKTK